MTVSGYAVTLPCGGQGFYLSGTAFMPQLRIEIGNPTLNSLTDLDTEQFRELKIWVGKSELGWPGFFFAAGLLLSNNPQVKWDQWASALIGISGLQKPQLNELFDSYSKEK